MNGWMGEGWGSFPHPHWPDQMVEMFIHGGTHSSDQKSSEIVAPLFYFETEITNHRVLFVQSCLLSKGRACFH